MKIIIDNDDDADDDDDDDAVDGDDMKILMKYQIT